MKPVTFVSLALVASVVWTACDPQRTTPSEPVPVIEPIHEMENCADITDYHVFGLTADLWTNAWAFALAGYLGIPPVDLTDAQRFRKVDYTELSAFMDGSESNDIRIYLAQVNPDAPNSEAVPDLVLVYADSCVDDTVADPLVVTANQTYRASQEEAVSYVRQWTNTFPNDSIFDPVYAYTYNRNSIQQLMDANPGEDIYLFYSVHARHALQVDNTGSFGEMQGYLILDLVISSGPEGNSMVNDLDFARPCPKLCDYGSPYYTPLIEPIE